MNRWKNLLALPVAPIFLSFLIALVNFADTTARLFFFYTSNQAYPLSTYLKPIFFISQTALLVYFIKDVRFSPKASSLSKKFQTLLDLQLVLATVAVILYFDSVIGNISGVVLPKQYVDAAWLLLFLLGPALTALWLGLSTQKQGQWKIGAVFMLVGVAFLGKPLEGFYFWTQTYAGYALPYSVVAFGMFTPLLLMVSALLTAVISPYSKLLATKASFAILRNPYFYTAGVIVLIPATLTSVKEGLPNTIIKAVVYWGLGYSWFDWFAVSLYFLSFVLYIFLIRQLTSRLDSSIPSTLIKLGFASFPWNGLTIMLFGYSSMAGNLLSLDAVLVGLLLNQNAKMEIQN